MAVGDGNLLQTRAGKGAGRMVEGLVAIDG